MDLRRLRAGEWIVALSGVALLVSLFLPWYDGKGTKQSAWNAFAVNDAILAVIAVAAIAQLFVTANQGVPAVPIAFLSIMTLAGALATVLVLVRVIWLPTGADARDWALWLGLAAAAGIVAGGWIGVRDERVSKPGSHTDATGRPSPPPPEVEALPAPRP